MEGVTQEVLGHGVELSAHAERFIHDKSQYVSELAELVDCTHACTDPNNKGNDERVEMLSRLEEKLTIAGLL